MIVRLSYNIIIVVDNIDLDKNINDASRKKNKEKGSIRYLWNIS